MRAVLPVLQRTAITTRYRSWTLQGETVLVDRGGHARGDRPCAVYWKPLQRPDGVCSRRGGAMQRSAGGAY